jgi:hypothetical protein
MEATSSATSNTEPENTRPTIDMNIWEKPADSSTTTQSSDWALRDVIVWVEALNEAKIDSVLFSLAIELLNGGCKTSGTCG